jgi:SpoIID/LytB domain protein
MSLAWTYVVRISAVLAALVVVVAAAASAQPAPPAGEALFLVSGHGWGHGVGMPQYGAYGMALEGRSHKEILAHFYTGTTLGRAGTKKLRVLLAEGRMAVSLTSPGAFSVVDRLGAKTALPRGALTLRPNLVFRGPKGKIKAKSPLLVRPGKGGPLTFDGTPFRGALELTVQNGYLRVINLISLDEYVQGVVANEMPFSWPSEALEAQAIAARTYALTSVQKGKPYHLYADVRDQVYRGVAGETERTNDAVRATAGKVVLYGGKLARTFYFSSSGGKTANAVDVFGSPVPYLVSRPDPWDRHSPHHSWGPILLGARTVQSKFGVGARVVDAVGVPTPSGRLKTFTLQTLEGPSKIPVTLLRTSLGLRSTWVTIGVLRLDPPVGPAVLGTPLRLTGIARGLEAPALAASVDGGNNWSKVGPVSRDATGAFSIDVKPTRTTRYRLQVKEGVSPPILVRVVGK